MRNLIWNDMANKTTTKKHQKTNNRIQNKILNQTIYIYTKENQG